MREFVENSDNVDHAEATLANVDALTLELRLMAEQNRHDINAIVDSVRRLTESLEDFTTETAEDVDVEMDKLHDATDELDKALEDVTSITGKIDRGEGTLGALVNDRETIDALNETIDNANAVIESFSGLHAEVYYLGRVYVGSQPQDPAFFYGNPLAPNANGGLGYSGSNTLGVGLYPQEDFWWNFEVNDYPQGAIRAEERYYPDLGTAYTEWTRRLDYRFTFQMNKRWWDVGASTRCQGERRWNRDHRVPDQRQAPAVGRRVRLHVRQLPRAGGLGSSERPCRCTRRTHPAHLARGGQRTAVVERPVRILDGLRRSRVPLHGRRHQTAARDAAYQPLSRGLTKPWRAGLEKGRSVWYTLSSGCA